MDDTVNDPEPPRQDTGTADQPAVDRPRRNFLAEAVAIVIGAVITLIPFVFGMVVFLHPLLRRKEKKGSEGFIRITTLDSVPDDGVPRQFPVIADRVDAWNYLPNELIGAVYVRRKAGEMMVQVFNVICPHAGCFVNHSAHRQAYHCPCHHSLFSFDGHAEANSPSPRDLDPMEVDRERLEKTGEVWIKFVNYLTGKAQRIPK